MFDVQEETAGLTQRYCWREKLPLQFKFRVSRCQLLQHIYCSYYNIIYLLHITSIFRQDLSLCSCDHVKMKSLSNTRRASQSPVVRRGKENVEPQNTPSDITVESAKKYVNWSI